MSLTKVAQHAGVSIATVSRVINDKPGIASDTRAVVLSTIGELGYMPKPLASRPGPKSCNRNKKVMNVLFLSFAQYKSQINSPVYAEIIHGVEAELACHSTTMIFKQVMHDEDVSAWISGRDIDGIILFSPSGTIIEWIKSQSDRPPQVPIVSMLGDVRNGWSDKIDYDKPAVAEAAFEYIISRGHKEFLEIHKSNHSAKLAELAKVHNVKIITLTNNVADVFITNEEENRPKQIELASIFEKYLASNKLPKAIFLPCDAFAVPVYSILMKNGFVAGRDFEAVSVNNEKSLLDGLMPRPATVDIRSYQMGRAAVQRLLWRKENPEEPKMTLTIEPILVKPDMNV
jgi:DNA-binding LacI/PurR family transcriptional regulator